ncbi:MAG TPA: nitroreductase family protein [Polyangiaceae bacterium]|nr:nitroreductase family protein [Polyangiaceae bacterium]
MRRRNFIAVTTQAGALLALPTLWACADERGGGSAPIAGTGLEPLPPSDDPFDAWQGPPPGVDDIRVIVLSYALLAPNPHNIQPWRVALRGHDTLDIYVEAARLLAASDPVYRQVHVGVGAFLELLTMAASAHGHRAELSYFPEGEYAATAIEPLPVARVRLVPDDGERADPLFALVRTRVSHKGAYTGEALPPGLLRGLTDGASRPGLRFAYADDRAALDALGELSIEAMRIDVEGFDRWKETIDTFRLNDAELLAHRSGTDARGLSAQGIGRELLLSHAPPVLEVAVQQLRDQAATASAYAWLASDENTRRAQLEAGRAYVRFNLAAHGAGLGVHPFSQALQEYEAMGATMARLRSRLGVGAGQTLQMFVRLGRPAGAQPHSARMRADAFTA